LSSNQNPSKVDSKQSKVIYKPSVFKWSFHFIDLLLPSFWEGISKYSSKCHLIFENHKEGSRNKKYGGIDFIIKFDYSIVAQDT